MTRPQPLGSIVSELVDEAATVLSKQQPQAVVTDPPLPVCDLLLFMLEWTPASPTMLLDALLAVPRRGPVLAIVLFWVRNYPCHFTETDEGLSLLSRLHGLVRSPSPASTTTTTTTTDGCDSDHVEAALVDALAVACNEILQQQEPATPTSASSVSERPFSRGFLLSATLASSSTSPLSAVSPAIATSTNNSAASSSWPTPALGGNDAQMSAAGPIPLLFLDISSNVLAQHIFQMQLDVFRSLRPSDFIQFATGKNMRKQHQPQPQPPPVQPSLDGGADAVASGGGSASSSRRASLQKGHQNAVVRGIRLFNQVAFWVVQMILNETVLKDRVQMLAKFIKVAVRLRASHDYNSLFAVYSGLTHNAVFRLRHTFDALPRRHTLSWELITAFLSPENNFQRYRQELKEHAQHSIPYIGLLISDLVHINDVYLRQSSPPDTINMPRLAANANLIKQALQADAFLPTIAVDPGLWKILHLALLPTVSEQEMDKLSYLREPRDGSQKRNEVSGEDKSSVFQTFISSTAKGLYGDHASSGGIDGRYADGHEDDHEDDADDNTRVESLVQELCDAIFRQFDKDNSNSLCIDEFETMASFFPFIYSFQTLDTNKDGIITRDELYGFLLEAHKGTIWNKLHKLFQHSIMPPGTLRCEVCTKVMWKSLVMGSYYRCINCGLAVHKHCRAALAGDCDPDASRPSSALSSSSSTQLFSNLWGSLTTGTSGQAATGKRPVAAFVVDDSASSTTTSVPLKPVVVAHEAPPTISSSSSSGKVKSSRVMHRRVRSEDIRHLTLEPLTPSGSSTSLANPSLRGDGNVSAKVTPVTSRSSTPVNDDRPPVIPAVQPPVAQPSIVISAASPKTAVDVHKEIAALQARLEQEAELLQRLRIVSSISGNTAADFQRSLLDLMEANQRSLRSLQLA